MLFSSAIDLMQITASITEAEAKWIQWELHLATTCSSVWTWNCTVKVSFNRCVFSYEDSESVTDKRGRNL